jgi:hypothetical protein
VGGVVMAAVKDHLTNRVRAHVTLGYFTRNKILEAHNGYCQAARLALGEDWPPPALVVDGVRLWSAEQASEILARHYPEIRFRLMARRFIVGEFLPKSYRFRKPADRRMVA